MSDLQTAIEALKKATEGSRELDYLIFEMMEFGFGGTLMVVRDYTTSIDAAETLWSTRDPLPKRTPYKALQYWNGYAPGGVPYWRVKALSSNGNHVHQIAIGDHRSKPIAACIASLRALKEDNNG